MELSKAYVQDKQIDFEICVKNTAMINIDENRLLSCIVNIIKNGIESINAKGKILIVGDIINNYAVLNISNNGKPIPKDKQNKIFDKGYTTKQTGSGVGLYICKKYLQSQNSDMKLVKSDKNKTEFEISIPIYN